MKEKLKKAKKLLKETLSQTCPNLEEETKDDKYLLFCNNELVGSLVKLDEDKLALTVYAPKISDPLHKNFLEKAKETFKNDLLNSGTKLSTGIEGNFYYTFVHIFLSP